MLSYALVAACEAPVVRPTESPKVHLSQPCRKILELGVYVACYL